MLPSLRPHRPLLLLRRLLSSSSTSGGRSAAGDGGAGVDSGDEVAAAEARREAYKQVHNLDFMTAAKILFTVPPKRKQFGLDFHLVQFFFACMPSLAVYLVAQYARYEIKRMEAEVEEKKKKAEEVEKAKQAELKSVEEDTDSKLSKVLVRLDTLEEVVKEIVDDKKKAPSSNLSNKQEVLKKEETSSSDKIFDSKSNAKFAEPTTKKKDNGGVTDPQVKTTPEESPKRHSRKVENEEKASGEPKT